MNMQELEFTGDILERGFWLYVWRVRSGKKEFYYVGRTGDNSSTNAASPFGRLSQHLDIRPNASADMLLRHVRKEGLDPLKCKYELYSYGPIFPEQKEWNKHVKYRDKVSPLECELAEYLHSNGLNVLGKHHSKKEADKELSAKIKRAFKAEIWNKNQ